MQPLVSLGLSACGAVQDALRVIESVRAQSLESWELLVVAGPEDDHEPMARLARHDPRIRVFDLNQGATGADNAVAAAWNIALESARGRFMMLLDGADLLEPDGLRRLVDAAERSTFGALFGGYAFRSPLGELPMDPLRELAREGAIGLDEWLGGKVLIPSCQLLRREAVGELRFDSALGGATAYDFALRLAARGVCWQRMPAKVATRRLGALVDHAATLESLWAHIRIVERAAAERSEPAPIRDELVRAYLLLVAFERIARLEPDRLLAVPVSIGPTFTWWWQRHGFHGPAPRHLLDQITSPDVVVPQHAELIAERLVEACEPGETVVLLGLGKNARPVARLLHGLGVAVTGRDDGLRTPPAWAAEDGVDIELIPAGSSFDPRAHYLMTVLDDERFLARLPAGLKVTRWRDMPGLIEREWRRVLGGRLAEGTKAWSPPAPTRGLFKLSETRKDTRNTAAAAAA